MFAGALAAHAGCVRAAQLLLAGLGRQLLLGAQLLPVREVHSIVQVLRHGLMVKGDLDGAEVRAVVHHNDDEDGQEDEDDDDHGDHGQGIGFLCHAPDNGDRSEGSCVLGLGLSQLAAGHGGVHG